MRAPKRDFVVEFKSRSRRSTVSKTPSIWGDTDLRAVASQLEEEELNASQSIPVAMGATGLTAFSEKSPAALVVGSQNSVDSQPIAEDSAAGPVVEADKNEKLAVVPEGAKPVAPNQVKQTKRLKPISRKIKKFQTSTLKETSSSSVTATTAAVTFSQLAELEAENKQLKAILGQRLATENARLKYMISRFE